MRTTPVAEVKLATEVWERLEKLAGQWWAQVDMQQVLLILLACLAAIPLAMLMRWLIRRSFQSRSGELANHFKLRETLANAAQPLAVVCLLALSKGVASHFLAGHQTITLALEVAAAWLLFRLLNTFLKDYLRHQLVAGLFWLIIILYITGLLPPILAALDRIGLDLDNNERISLLSISKAVALLVILLPLTNRLCHFLTAKIETLVTLKPGAQLLLVKVLKIVLYTVIIVVVLDSAGFDFHLFFVFSGALGLGAGFGLQRVISNLVSGLIILMDESIRPGDVIEVAGVYGWIESLRARYVSVITRDGTAYLLPNDQLFSNQVINWSFSGPGVRQKIPVGISYNSDLHQAMALMVAAADRFPRVLKHPPPQASLIKYADSAIQLELRFWINDPQNGLTNVKSDIQIAIWDAFKQHGIVFPYPQQDLYLKTTPEITVRIQEKQAEEEYLKPIDGGKTSG